MRMLGDACPKCERTDVEFHVGASVCKACRSIQMRAYRAANLEKLRQADRDYHAANREKNNAASRARNLADPENHRRRSAEWYAANREKGKMTRRAYYLANIEKAKATMRANRAANLEKYKDRDRVYSAESRARVAGTGGTFTMKDWRRLCVRFDDCCAYCGAKAKLTVEHVVPLSRGGSNFIGNILPACLPCNNSKRKRLLIEWRRHLPSRVRLRPI